MRDQCLPDRAYHGTPNLNFFFFSVSLLPCRFSYHSCVRRICVRHAVRTFWASRGLGFLCLAILQWGQGRKWSAHRQARIPPFVLGQARRQARELLALFGILASAASTTLRNCPAIFREGNTQRLRSCSFFFQEQLTKQEGIPHGPDQTVAYYLCR